MVWLTASRGDPLVVAAGFRSRDVSSAQTTPSHLLCTDIFASSLSLLGLSFSLSSSLLRFEVLVTKNQTGKHEINDAIMYQAQKSIAASL
jgi:hypothetical protein